MPIGKYMGARADEIWTYAPRTLSIMDRTVSFIEVGSGLEGSITISPSAGIELLECFITAQTDASSTAIREQIIVRAAGVDYVSDYIASVSGGNASMRRLLGLIFVDAANLTRHRFIFYNGSTVARRAYYAIGRVRIG